MGLCKICKPDFQKFEFETEDPTDVLHFFVMDQGVTSDTIIGAARIRFKDLCAEGGNTKWVRKTVTPSTPSSLRTNLLARLKLKPLSSMENWRKHPSQKKEKKSLKLLQRLRLWPTLLLDTNPHQLPSDSPSLRNSQLPCPSPKCPMSSPRPSSPTNLP